MVAIIMEQLDERKRTPEVGGRTQDVRLLGSRRFHGVLYGFTVVSQTIFFHLEIIDVIYIYTCRLPTYDFFWFLPIIKNNWFNQK